MYIGKHEKLGYVPKPIFITSGYDGIVERCPKCKEVFSHYGNLESIGFERVRKKIYRHRCGQLLDMS